MLVAPGTEFYAACRCSLSLRWRHVRRNSRIAPCTGAFFARSSLSSIFRLTPTNVNGVNPNIRDPYTEQINLTVERQVGPFGFRVSYVGSRSIALLYLRNLNEPAPTTTPFFALPVSMNWVAIVSA